MPRPITLSADVSHWFEAPLPVAPSFPTDGQPSPPPAPACIFCDAPSGRPQLQADGAVACPLCVLPLHLDRPRIDEEAVLAWLPEMSQLAVNALMRNVHIRLRALGEDVEAGASYKAKSPAHGALHAARAVLTERTASAAIRLGTSAPSELGHALIELPASVYDERSKLLGGLRLLPLGRFFDGDQDVYPDVVDRWIAAAKAQVPAAQTAT